MFLKDHCTQCIPSHTFPCGCNKVQLCIHLGSVVFALRGCDRHFDLCQRLLNAKGQQQPVIAQGLAGWWTHTRSSASSIFSTACLKSISYTQCWDDAVVVAALGNAGQLLKKHLPAEAEPAFGADGLVLMGALHSSM